MSGESFVQMTLSAGGRDPYLVLCRLANGKAGTFTVPQNVWTQLPDAIRTAGAGTLSVSSGLTATLPVPELDHGLRVAFPQSTFIQIRMNP